MDLNNNGKDDGQEIIDGATDFISQEGILIGTAVGNAVKWLQGEIAGIPSAVQAKLADIIKQAKGDGTKPVGEVVADALTIAYNDGHAIFDGVEAEVVAGVKAIDSAVIEAAARITTVVP